MEILHANASEFEKMVLKSEGTVLVDFWASWCGPCRMLAPVLEEFAAAHKDVTVVKVNVDEEAELAHAYRISAIPALLLFRNGELEKNAMGFQSREALEELLK